MVRLMQNALKHNMLQYVAICCEISAYMERILSVYGDIREPAPPP